MKPDLNQIRGEFPRRLPVFPVAEVVLFPGAVLPLHIFEHRYRDMVTDVMEGDRLFALALLKKCDADEYLERPPFHETVCVGYVLHHEPLADGRSNIAVLGVSAAVAAPTESGASYRVADMKLLDDSLDPGRGYESKLVEVFSRTIAGGDNLDGLRAQLGQLLDADRVPAALVNTCALTAPILPFDKLGLLEERSVSNRLDRLVHLLERPWQWN